MLKTCLKRTEKISDFFKINSENEKFYKKLLKIVGKDESLKLSPHERWEYFRKNKHCVLLQVTKKCNSKCKICYMANENYEEITIKDLKWILKKIGKKKVILFEGGEPTTRKDIFQMIELVKKSGNIPEIYTNGLKLANLKYVKKLKKSGLSRVHFSFDGFREEIYKKLRGDGRQLQLKIRALKNLQKVGIKTILSSVISCGVNEDQISELLKFCALSAYKNDFIEGIRFFGIVPYGRFEIDVEKFMKPIDIMERLEMITNGGIRKEYFLEFKRFLMNLNNLFGKFGIYFPYYYAAPTAIFKVTMREQFSSKINNFNIANNDGGIIEIKELIELKELKKINDMLEKFKLPSLMIYTLKMKLVKHILNLIKGKLRDSVLGRGRFVISVGLPISPISTRGMKTDSWDIRKYKGRITLSSVGVGAE